MEQEKKKSAPSSHEEAISLSLGKSVEERVALMKPEELKVVAYIIAEFHRIKRLETPIDELVCGEVAFEVRAIEAYLESLESTKSDDADTKKPRVPLYERVVGSQGSGDDHGEDDDEDDASSTTTELSFLSDSDL